MKKLNIPSYVIQTLTITEKKIYQYLLTNQDTINDLSITQLSGEIYVSSAAIIKLLKKFSFSGYTEFKYFLKEKTLVDLTTNETKKQLHLKLIEKNKFEFDKTIDNLDFRKIDRLVNDIKSANNISIFSRGFTHYIAEEFAIKLNMFGNNCITISDPELMKKLVMRKSTNDLIIIFSLSGNTKELIEVAQKLSTQLKLIVITTNKYGLLNPYANYVIYGTKANTTLVPDFDIHSRMPLYLISRLIADVYIYQLNYGE